MKLMKTLSSLKQDSTYKKIIETNLSQLLDGWQIIVDKNENKLNHRIIIYLGRYLIEKPILPMIYIVRNNVGKCGKN